MFAHYAEALQLIEAGVTKDILILGYAIIDYTQPFLPHALHFMVDTLEYATYLNTLGKTYAQQISIHIKIDTGLSRLGINPSEYSYLFSASKNSRTSKSREFLVILLHQTATAKLQMHSLLSFCTQ